MTQWSSQAGTSGSLICLFDFLIKLLTLEEQVHFVVPSIGAMVQNLMSFSIMYLF